MSNWIEKAADRPVISFEMPAHEMCVERQAVLRRLDGQSEYMTFAIDFMPDKIHINGRRFVYEGVSDGRGFYQEEPRDNRERRLSELLEPVRQMAQGFISAALAVQETDKAYKSREELSVCSAENGCGNQQISAEDTGADNRGSAFAAEHTCQGAESKARVSVEMDIPAQPTTPICYNCGKDLIREPSIPDTHTEPGHPAVWYCPDCGIDFPARACDLNSMHETAENATPTGPEIYDTHGSLGSMAAALRYAEDLVGGDSFGEHYDPTVEGLDKAHGPRPGSVAESIEFETNYSYPEDNPETLTLQAPVCVCVRPGRITDENLPYQRSIAPYGMKGLLADCDCPMCCGTGRPSIPDTVCSHGVPYRYSCEDCDREHRELSSNLDSVRGPSKKRSLEELFSMPDVILSDGTQAYLRDLGGGLSRHRHQCACVRPGQITDKILPYRRSIAPHGMDGFLADRDCLVCYGTGLVLPRLRPVDTDCSPDDGCGLQSDLHTTASPCENMPCSRCSEVLDLVSKMIENPPGLSGIRCHLGHVGNHYVDAGWVEALTRVKSYLVTGSPGTRETL